MSQTFARLHSFVPQHRSANAGKLDLKSDALRHWVEELPWGHPELVARLLLEALCEANATLLKPQRRLEVLETLRSPASRLLDDSVVHAQSDIFPMPAPRRRIFSNVQEFEREFVAGYISVLCDLCSPEGAVPMLQRGVAALAATRATQHLGERLLNVYLAHSSPETGVWRCLHDLFLFVVAAHCDDKDVVDPLLEGGKTSARKAYMQALLHAFAKPYNFTQKDNQALCAALPVLVEFCDVRPGLAPQGAITVCTDGDNAPPGPRHGCRTEVSSLWLLDVNALVTALDTELVKCRDNLAATSITITAPVEGSTQLPIDLAQRLVGVWARRRERASARVAERFDVDTVIGMYAVHNVLARGMDFNEFRRATHRAGAAQADHNVPAGMPACVQSQFACAEVLDRSSGGYRIRWSAGACVRIRVGEIVAVASTRGSRANWMVGMLRWLRVDESGAVEAGIQTLALEARAISVCAYDVYGFPEPPMRGLLMPECGGSGGDSAPYIIVSELFDRTAIRIEEAGFEEPDYPESIRVETISDFYICDFGGLYRQIVLPLPPHADLAEAA